MKVALQNMKEKVNLYKIMVLFLIVAITISLNLNSINAGDLPATMEEGETRTFILGGIEYIVNVLIIDDTSPATVTFEINGELTGDLLKGEIRKIDNRTTIEVLDIILNEAGEAGSGDLVTFTFYYCGDRVCSKYENCSFCSADCGCDYGYYCAINICKEVICGDGICSQDEICYKDRCCDGKILDMCLWKGRNWGSPPRPGAFVDSWSLDCSNF